MVTELSSCARDKVSLFPPKNDRLSPPFPSPLPLREDRGSDTAELLLLCRAFEPNAVNLNRGSIESKFLDWGGLLWAAYGSFASPCGVNGLLNDPRVGLCSLDAGTERVLPGPIEKVAPRCPCCTPDSVDRLVGWVAIPEEPGRESSTLVVVGDVPDVPGEICGVTAAGSS
jgi:hypothetical protein